MSTTGKHVRNRHQTGPNGLAETRDTHGPPGFSPSVTGMSYADARDGEQSQTPDLAPGSVDGTIIGETVIEAMHIVPETLSLDLFAETIRPPSIVDALPALPDDSYIEGQLAFLTTDGKLYRNVADVWTVEVDGGDIIAGSIVAGKIAAGAIGADEIAAEAITTEKFHVGAKAPGVENSTSEVLIDDTGITILNGKLFLLDSAGSSVLEGAGFGGSWLDFLKTSAYNGTFSSGIGHSIPPPAKVEVTTDDDLPYWTVNRQDGATTTNAKVYHASASDAYYVYEARLAMDNAPIGADLYLEQVIPLSAVVGRRGEDATGGISVRLVAHGISITSQFDHLVRVSVTPLGYDAVSSVPSALEAETFGTGTNPVVGVLPEVSVDLHELPSKTSHLLVRVWLSAIAATDCEVAIRNVIITPSVPEILLTGHAGNPTARMRATFAATTPALELDPAVGTAPADKMVSIDSELRIQGENVIQLHSSKIRWYTDVELSSPGNGALTLNTGARLDQQIVGRGVWKSSSQSIPTSTWTKITAFTNSLIVGIEGSYNSTNSTVVIGTTGYYLITLTARIITASANSRFAIGFLAANNADPGSGAPNIRHTDLRSAASANNYYMTASFVAQLAALDHIAAEVWHDSGVNKSFDQVTLNVIRLGIT